MALGVPGAGVARARGMGLMAREGSVSVGAVQLAPASVDLQTPPLTVPAYRRLVLSGSTATAWTAPTTRRSSGEPLPSREEPLVIGPGPSSFQSGTLEETI